MGGWQMMPMLRMLALALAAIFAGAVVSEIPPLPAWFERVDAHQAAWLVATGAAALLGLALTMGGILDLLIARGRPLDHDGAEDVARSVRLAALPVTWRASSYRVWGQATGRAGADEFTFGAMKEAWRSGAWRRDTDWRRRYVTALGALLMTMGVFGLAFALGPPPIKVLTAGALLYALGMIGRGVWKSPEI